MIDDFSSLKSELLERSGFRHAFFTRRGGVSEGPYASLSFSLAVGDAAEHVAENLRRAGSVLGVPAERIYYLSQVHGRTSHVADESQLAESFVRREGDAVIALRGRLACGVRSADCVPVLVADRETGAVAAIHAGWRGVVARVVPETISALREKSGDFSHLLAAIGPHISAAAFEVSPEVATQLAGSSSAKNVVLDGSKGRPHVDLRRIVRAQLLEAGVPEPSIDDVFGCTVTDPERFFSFRRDGGKSGRHLSAIVPRVD